MDRKILVWMQAVERWLRHYLQDAASSAAFSAAEEYFSSNLDKARVAFNLRDEDVTIWTTLARALTAAIEVVSDRKSLVEEIKVARAKYTAKRAQLDEIDSHHAPEEADPFEVDFLEIAITLEEEATELLGNVSGLEEKMLETYGPQEFQSWAVSGENRSG